MEQGALDVAILPAQMKKDRPGILFQVLAKPAHADSLQATLLSETSTLGVRRNEVRRDSLPRRIETIETKHGSIRVKIAEIPGHAAKVIPEYEDCRTAAEKSGLPLREIFATVKHDAAHALHLPHDHGHSHDHGHDHTHKH